MILTFLQADRPLTKTYEKTNAGDFLGGSYPGVFNCSSHTSEVQTIQDFADHLNEHAAKGHCLLTNSLTRKIENESRAKLAVEEEEREWLLLDIDGIEGITDADDFIMKMLPKQFHKCSYVLQHSPSSGIKPGVRAHVFFLLDRAISVKHVSAWLKHQNLATQSLSNQVTLSKNSMALSLKLDWVANNNGRIVYITPPVCKGFDDPIDSRISVVTKKYDTLQFNFTAMSTAELRAKYRARLNELRLAAGLTVSRAKDIYRTLNNGTEVVRNEVVEPARITSFEADNDFFMRCNIDGGDSFAYYYHRNNPKYLHNFKGEPSIPLKLLDADFYARVAGPDFEVINEKDTRPFLFRDGATDKWYTGLRKENVVISQPNAIGSEKKISDYFMQNGGMSPPDPIETWERTFDPGCDVQYLPERKEFNLWRPTEYMTESVAQAKPPALIARIISHVLADDPESINHFINWLAFIFQNRKKAGTAWVLHGCPGTGKGLLFDNIIRPLFGLDYCEVKQMRDLRDKFNGWMQSALFVNINEANTAGDINSTETINALKQWITDPFMSVRHMHSQAIQMASFINFVFTTNDFGSLPIQDGDRRFNVAPRQETPIAITNDEVRAIRTELMQFAGFLSAYEVDSQQARTPMENEAKASLKVMAASSVNQFVAAFKENDFEYFYEARDEVSDEHQLKDSYLKWLERCIDDIKNDRTAVTTVTELRAAYVVIVGNKKMPAARFRSLMAKQGFPAKKMSGRDGVRRTGWSIKWDVEPEFCVSIKAHIKPIAKTQEEMEDAIRKEIAESPEAPIAKQ